MDLIERICSYTFILASAFLMIAVEGRNDQCPDIVKRSPFFVENFRNMCYLFVSDEKTWIEANRNCLHMGGDLLIIRDQQTMDFVKNVLNSDELDWRNNGVWNGANDLKRDGWEWSTGEKLGYEYWDSGEPSTFLGLGFLSLENCALMSRKDNWRWHDYHCEGGAVNEYTYRSVCQFHFENSHIKTSVLHQNQAAAHSDDDSNVTGIIIGFLVGAGALLVLFILILLFIYRRRRRMKHEAEAEDPSVRFHNLAYSQVGQNEGQGEVETRPLSAVYADPNEMNRLYEEVTKEVNHGRNINSCSSDHACTHQNESEADGGASGKSADLIPSEECCAKTCVASATGAAASSKNDPCTAPENEYVEMGGNVAKSTNLYVKPNKVSDDSKPSNLDLSHMYSNESQLETSDYLHPVDSEYLCPLPAEDPLYEHVD